jgi:Arylsulfotransferase (ASST)
MEETRKNTLKIALVVVCSLLMISMIIGGCGSDDPVENEKAGSDQPGPRTGETEVGSIVGQSDPGDSERVPRPALKVIVEEPPLGNLLARRIVVTSDIPCTIIGRVTHPDEPGYLPSSPEKSAEGLEHSLWFYGLFPDAEFDFDIRLGESPDKSKVRGSFSTPSLDGIAPFPAEVVNSSKEFEKDWIAIALNWGRIDESQGGILILDRKGRTRARYEIPDPPDFVFGLRVFSDRSLATNDNDLVFFSPDGSIRHLGLNLNAPYLDQTHHGFFIPDYDFEKGLVLFNRFGSGLWCDLETPSEMVIGDGIAVVDKTGNELWRWTIFDAPDEIPISDMDPLGCLVPFWGIGTADFTHGNGVTPVGDENAFILSLRNVLRLVKVNMDTGLIEWQMGPRMEDFEWITPEAEGDQWFYRQHDPTWIEPDRLLLFDNGNARPTQNGRYSRALELRVNQDDREVELIWEHRIPFSGARGSVERNSNGNTLISTGWTGQIYDVSTENEELWFAEFPYWFRVAEARYFPSHWVYEETP